MPAVNMTMNSSYVLIIITPSDRLGSGERTSPGCPGKYTIKYRDDKNYNCFAGKTQSLFQFSYGKDSLW